MKQNKLTESAVKKTNPTAKQYKLSDGGGLYLLVHSNGSKYWRFDFRFDGKQKSSSLGVWPEVSLATARRKRDQAKSKIKEGVNPIQEKKEKKSIQFQQVQEKAKAEHLELPRPQHISQQEEIQQAPQLLENNTKSAVNLLKSHVYPELGGKAVSELGKEDVTEILKNLYCSRKEVFQLIWDIYPDYPLVQLSVMFILLLGLMGFFSALLTTSLYIVFTVCITIGINVWHEKSAD
ncbi:MAG: integrase arm-type DNA-binding domain-containing protein [Proteobacteria bacterium]|jgi:hypothetical protein|nr:integrase arm-type DNA-binding domain-containing protein [Pseudomonadota bacterium]MDB3917679.1 integrase arm-type DNA-binding domain-containing protein [bacterium]